MRPALYDGMPDLGNLFFRQSDAKRLDLIKPACMPNLFITYSGGLHLGWSDHRL